MVFLNHAATSWPKAPGVVEAVRYALDQPPSGRPRSRDADPANDCRELLAELLSIDEPSRIIFTLNATMALNLAIQSLGLRHGDLIVTSTAEHNSVLRPIERLRRKRGIKSMLAPLDASGLPDPERFQRALGRGPRLVVLSHASNVTGRIFPAGYWFQEARRAGAVTLLDASQSLGRLPVSPSELAADLVAFPGHKGLLGPAGTGGLYVSRGIDLEPYLAGGTETGGEFVEHPTEMPGRLEAGTPNLPGLAGLAAALRWLTTHGQEHRDNERVRAAQLRNGLATIPGVQIFDTADGERIGIVSFRIDGWGVAEAAAALNDNFGIVCQGGLHHAPRIHDSIGSAPQGTIRFSVSGFTTEMEISAAIAAVDKLRGPHS